MNYRNASALWTPRASRTEPARGCQIIRRSISIDYGHFDLGDAALAEAETVGRGSLDVDNTATHERPAIIDAQHDRFAV